MKIEMNKTNRAIAAALAVALLAGAFWVLLLSPKREEAQELGAQVEKLEVSLARHEAEVAEAEEAREEFPVEYQRLVVLGKAVPADDDVASLLVQINQIGKQAGGSFRNIKLSGGGGGGEPASTAPPAASGGEPVPPTEVAAALVPLGASVGPAGLAVMPYDVAFDGNFFQVADFIKGLDSLVTTKQGKVRVDGRLVTIDGFELEVDQDAGFPALEADFSLTTYLTPPDEGVTAGASPDAPPVATPVATTTGGAR
jgi:Tfp pilus assembly protein PilO